MNRDLLMCDTTYFRVDYVINPYMDVAVQPDLVQARREHEALVESHRAASRVVRRIPSASECPDMVYTANVAFVASGLAVLGAPPVERSAEIPYVRSWLKDHEFEVLDCPYDFSGQGDALVCGQYLFVGHGQRTDRRVPGLLDELFGFEVVPLRVSSERWYDLDLAVGVIDPHTVACCPEALDRPSLAALRSLDVDVIEVSIDEAARFALNLISDGSTVTMTRGAPELAAMVRERGMAVVELGTDELRKGGGGIRCTALTLDNSAPARR
ncbi:dimethylarginine dimethylaminohydrolase family protein [Streptomyces sp. PSAA01]|uniref:dimethylarginine dimethylaminohydrolase family protein n=1 Tax=Streptomyces sp. PSAA01 TaxID=2912762 RepID=UPI001F35ADF7|nr:arginine deiminase-related protein [Streptomyces sp. PSAA01]MCG0283773.1 arginine deiminase-related protein [Streptomyces sp. PSAA01]